VISVLEGKQSSVVDTFGIGVGSMETDIRHAYGQIRIGVAHTTAKNPRQSQRRSELGLE
jgi:hypothetical protein